MRLGVGEVTKTVGRDIFFRAIERVAPEVINSLVEEVLPSYCTAWDKGKRVLTREQLAGKAPEIKALREALCGWCWKWWLRSPWCIDYAIFLCHMWHNSPDRMGKIWALPDGGPFEFPLKEIHPDLRNKLKDETGQQDEIPEPPTFDEWEPWLETRKTYLERAKAVLERYCDQVLAVYKQVGWQENVEKRNRSGSPLVHFKWLVRYQVQGWEYEKIAQEFTDQDPLSEAVIGTDAIRKAITATAELIGLPLRE